MDSKQFKKMNEQIRPDDNLIYRIKKEAYNKKQRKQNKFIPILITIIAVIALAILASKMLSDGNTDTGTIVNNEETEPPQSNMDMSSDTNAEREIYMMNMPDEINEEAISIGQLYLSNGVREFLKLNLEDNQYLPVNITIWGEFVPFMYKSEYIYEGKSVTEWRNDTLVREHDNYVDEFKEKYAQTEEYIIRKEKGELEDMYNEYLESIANEENNLSNIIAQYNKYREAETAYETAANEYRLVSQKSIYTAETERLTNIGLYVELKLVDESYYIIEGELNQNDINNFDVGEYGYTITLQNIIEAMDE